MITRKLIEAPDGAAGSFSAFSPPAAIPGPCLNLLFPPASPLHVPNLVVALWGKYLCYALLALSLDWCGALAASSPPLGGHGARIAAAARMPRKTPAAAVGRLDELPGDHAFDRPAFSRKQAAGRLLDEQDHDHEQHDLAQHRAGIGLEKLVGDAQRHGADQRAPKIADTSEHHHQEAVDDIALAEVGETLSICDSATPARPAMPDPSAKVKASILPVLIAIELAMRRFCVTARICRPSSV